jgi:hypothetical protein
MRSCSTCSLRGTRYNLRMPTPPVMASPRESLKALTKRWDEFDQLARKDVAVEKPKSRDHLIPLHILAAKAFSSQLCDAERARDNDSEPEIWRACRKTVTTVDAGIGWLQAVG